MYKVIDGKRDSRAAAPVPIAYGIDLSNRRANDVFDKGTTLTTASLIDYLQSLFKEPKLNPGSNHPKTA